MPPVLKGKDEPAIRAELLEMNKRMKKTIFAELDAHVCDDNCEPVQGLKNTQRVCPLQ
jgi:hypothetical protein